MLRLTTQTWRKSSTVLVQGAVLLCLVVAGIIGYARLSGYELLSVQSNSMSPALHKGDAVLVRRGNVDPRLGDIISFKSPLNPKVVITHRVVGVDNHRGMIETRGDNTSLVDQPIPAWDVVGKVTTVLPGVGTVLAVFKNPVGLLALIYAPALSVILSEINRLSTYYETGLRPIKRVHYRLRPSYASKLL